MYNTLLQDIKDTLAKCDDVLLDNQKIGSSLEPQLVIRATRYRGRFYIKEIDDNTVSIRCDPKNHHGSYYRFNLTRDEYTVHIRIKLADHAWDDAFGAMGEDYYRKPIEKFVERVENNTIANYKQSKLIGFIESVKGKLGRFTPMPIFEKPGEIAFIMEPLPLVLILKGRSDEQVLITTMTPDNGRIDNLYQATLVNNNSLVLERINEINSVLPTNLIFAVNDFVCRLQNLLTSNKGE